MTTPTPDPVEALAEIKAQLEGGPGFLARTYARNPYAAAGVVVPIAEPQPRKPKCCGDPMVLYRHVAWECMAAYSLLLEEGVIADDGATPPTWIGEGGQAALRERYDHLLATRIVIDADDPGYRLAARTAPARDPLEDKVRALADEWARHALLFSSERDKRTREDWDHVVASLRALLPDAATKEVRRG